MRLSYSESELSSNGGGNFGYHPHGANKEVIPCSFQVQAKGLSRCLVAASLDPKKLRFHITEVEVGNRSHAAHTHSGVEAFYMLEGHSTVEVEDERYPLGPNEAIVVDASRPHGIFNSGSTRIKYMVIIVQD
jgi:mannose-6-phosphate isomerase-like protein (cupin superfamily)